MAPPAPAPTQWLDAPAFIWREEQCRPIAALDALPLEKLWGIDQQKQAVVTNLERFASGSAAHDMLLWGARGMGKSALVRAVVAHIQAKAATAIALVQILPGSLAALPVLIEALSREDRSFLLYIDDLGFDVGHTQDSLALRSLLDGGVQPRPGNVRLAVTSNRRAIVARKGDEDHALHSRDARDDALALVDRFGLTLGFHPCDQATYLQIVRAYIDPLGLTFDDAEALSWAIARGNRSGRTAYQFATEVAGRANMAL